MRERSHVCFATSYVNYIAGRLQIAIATYTQKIVKEGMVILNLKSVSRIDIKGSAFHTGQRLASSGWLARSSPRVCQVAKF